MASLRTALKPTIEAIMSSRAVSRMARVRLRDQVLILGYHNVVPDEVHIEGDQSLHLPVSSFARQLDLLSESADVVPLSEVLAGSWSSTHSSRPKVAITFDDAYCGAVAVGVPELRRRSLPATIFVTPGLLGNQTFWWDSVRSPRGGPLTDTIRRHALCHLKGQGSLIESWGFSQGLPIAPANPYARSASESELRLNCDHPEITLGSHTWSHPNLTEMTDEELRCELVRPKEWLESRFNNTIPWLTYPYGCSNRRVEEAARDAGYHAALLIEGRWFEPMKSNPFALPRVNIPAGLSTEGFAARLSGFLCG